MDITDWPDTFTNGGGVELRLGFDQSLKQNSAFDNSKFNYNWTNC